jgi:uncharacterized protein YndB with AHSA1/START domain
MSRTNTQSISIASPPEKVFAFVADPENLPVWAIGFCKEIRIEDERWIVTTPSGEQIPMRSVADAERGLLDGTWEMGPLGEGRSYTRVVPSGDGAEYVFTMVQASGMPDEVFDAQAAELGRELTVLKAHLETACPL